MKPGEKDSVLEKYSVTINGLGDYFLIARKNDCELTNENEKRNRQNARHPAPDDIRILGG